AERALGIEPRNPWAQHALSHVLIRRGRVGEGLARLEAFLPLLATCGRPIHCHDAWHLALLHLEELDVAAAMRVFKAHIWGITPDFVVEQLDAIALLWRIEMAAGPTDAQWPAIAEHIAPRAVETFMPFMNAHYVYALARAGRADAVEAVLARVRAQRSRRRGSETGMGAGGTRGDRGGGRLRRRRSRARRRIARSGHADDDSDRRQGRPRRPVSPDLSAQPAGRGTPCRCRGVFRGYHRR